MSKDIEYDLDALKEGIVKAKKNVKIFEEAIQREYDTVKHYTGLIAQLEVKRASANVNTT